MAKRERSIDDLLGTAPAKKAEVETGWEKLYKGVSLNWLCGFLQMDRRTVKKRLADCPTIPGSGTAQGELYDPKLALSYLVKPRFDIRSYIKTMNPTELPPMLRKEFWDAEMKKQTWKQRAGELWHTEQVLSVVSEAFTRAKNIIQIWPDDLERQVGLTKEQYRELIKRTDALREELYRSLITLMQDNQTPSSLDDIDIDEPEEGEIDEDTPA